MAPFYGWGSTASRLHPLRGGSLLFTIQFPIYIYIYNIYNIYKIYIYIIYSQNLLTIKHELKWMVKFVKTENPLLLHTFLTQYN